jgi:hypothetical protein
MALHAGGVSKMKAMRRRIALLKHFVRNLEEDPRFVSRSFGVRACPRVALAHCYCIAQGSMIAIAAIVADRQLLKIRSNLCVLFVADPADSFQIISAVKWAGSNNSSSHYVADPGHRR